MWEIRTSGLTRGSNETGASRPLLSTRLKSVVLNLSFGRLLFRLETLGDGETVLERGPACSGRIDLGDLKSKSGRLLTAVIVKAGE